MNAESDRLERLEREVAILRAEFAKLRDQLGSAQAPRGASRTPPPPPRADYVPPPPPAGSFTPRPAASEPAAAPRRRRSFEDVIGRYVVVVIGTLLVLLGFGVFLNWAIRSGLLGPTARVVLGYVGAVALAYGGVHLRLRGTREYGNVLLAIALGIVHLVCWSAGPLLHVLPTLVALGIGFAASVALAEFALRHEEEMLCAIGFGGAALAPFIAGESDGNRIALAIYGVIVVALGAAALGGRDWKYARGVAMWSIVLYTLASGAGAPVESPPAWISSRLWIITPVLMAIAVIPFTHAVNRRAMIRMSAGALILGALMRADQWQPDLASVIITLVGTIIIIGALDVTRPTALEREAPVAALDARLVDRATLLDAFLIPVGLFVATVASTPDLTSFQSAAVALAFAGGALFMTHRTRGEPEGERYASTASLIALWIVPAAFFDQDLARVAGCAAMGILLMTTAERMQRLPFVAGAFGSMTIASLFALDSVRDRPDFLYLPFLTIESAGALLAIAAWIVATRMVGRPQFLLELEPDVRVALREAFITGAAATGFFWGVLELSWALNQTAATALLILYYAATGALMIYVGRLRNVRHLRLIGLAVALWGAWKAIVEAFGIPNTAVRIAVFLGVSAFLIGIGYWYRRGAGDEDGSLSPAPGV